MSLPESKLLNKGKSVAKQYAKQKMKKAVSKALNSLLKKALKWIVATAGPTLLIWLLILTAVFAVIDSAKGTYNFTGAVEPDAIQDAALKARYEQVSESTVSSDLIAKDETTAMYQVPWGLFAAIDKVLNNCEKPEPEKYVGLLKPEFHMRDSEITIVTTVTDTDGGYSQSTKKDTTSLVDTVDTYKGLYRHNYVWSTTETSSSHTETRTGYDEITKEEYSYEVTVTTSVETTKEILSGIQQPIPFDYSRLLNALNTFGIDIETDQEMVWELAKAYAGEVVDLTQPVTDLMGFSDFGLIKGGAPPPSEWIPYFEAAAERYHGDTDVNEFEALLMAISYTESSFSDSRNVISSAGALGPMQFLPSTFADYGVRDLGYSPDDIWDPGKAIMAAALMLSRDGADNGTIGGIRTALWHYNQSVAYADLVVSRMYYYGAYTGWEAEGVSPVSPGDPSTKGFYWPVPGYSRITDPFGPRTHPVTGKYSYHEGIDIAADMLAPIIAPKDGIVEEVNYNSGPYGYYIYIRHDEQVETFYGHMQTIMPDIVPGAQVKAGQVIALTGSRGWSTGPHLDFRVRYNGYFVNPLLFVTQP